MNRQPAPRPGLEPAVACSPSRLPPFPSTARAGEWRSMAREPLAELEVPERLRSHPAAVPDGPAGNIARAYARLAEAIREGTRF